MIECGNDRGIVGRAEWESICEYQMEKGRGVRVNFSRYIWDK